MEPKLTVKQVVSEMNSLLSSNIDQSSSKSKLSDAKFIKKEKTIRSSRDTLNK